MATPNITLTATLDDFSGNAIGSATQPAYLRIALCGYGQTLPLIAGTAMVGKVSSWPGDIPYVGTLLTVSLWGNDQITPSNTYYMISILDASKNVIQSGIYQFTGTATIDLSNATQLTQPTPNPPGAEVSALLKANNTAGSNSYNLPLAPLPGTLVLLFLNGIKLLASRYTVSGVTVSLTFTTAFGDSLEAVYFQV